ncbi:hypothetical protein HH1059_20720 [Halorhodospira halochloris]|uniref:Uncharacterized protein n=1 Tax=Halorhodospira halochloris TaxID=1052 RepID=A0A2Z6EZY5_HALHR|nr:hypothetical protein HH1059_20720 [Halorhodospira halochloris]
MQHDFKTKITHRLYSIKNSRLHGRLTSGEDHRIKLTLATAQQLLQICPPQLIHPASWH